MLQATEKHMQKKCRQALTSNIHPVSHRSAILPAMLTRNINFIKVQLNIWVTQFNSSGINDFNVTLNNWNFSIVSEFKHKLKVH